MKKIMISILAVCLLGSYTTVMAQQKKKNTPPAKVSESKNQSRK